MFSDVPPSHWAYQAVADLKRRGILLGYPADKNAPGEPKVTKAKPAAKSKTVVRASVKTVRKASARKA